MCWRSRRKPYQAAGEPVFGVNNSAVFLRKILELFSMAKRQNFSMQPGMVFDSAPTHHLYDLAIKHGSPAALCTFQRESKTSKITIYMISQSYQNKTVF